MIFVIGLSRIYLGVHFPHQVLGGWAVGFVLLMGWFFFGRELKKKE
jgi:undecaprenyl-diphosphatase